MDFRKSGLLTVNYICTFGNDFVQCMGTMLKMFVTGNKLADWPIKHILKYQKKDKRKLYKCDFFIVNIMQEKSSQRHPHNVIPRMWIIQINVRNEDAL